MAVTTYLWIQRHLLLREAVSLHSPGEGTEKGAPGQEPAARWMEKAEGHDLLLRDER